jgi:inositol transport system permease protein
MTLAMMTVARGLVFIYTRGFPIYNIGAINFLGKGDLLGVPIPVVVMLALAIFSGVLLSKTRFGRYLYAIGGSEDAAIAARDLVDCFYAQFSGERGRLHGHRWGRHHCASGWMNWDPRTNARAGRARCQRP